MKKDKKQTRPFGIKALLFLSITFSTLLVGVLTFAIVNAFFVDDVDIITTAVVVGVPLVASSIISIFFAITATKRRFFELNVFLKALDKVSKGDFSVQLDDKGVRTMAPVYNSFNTMVKELNNMETLSSDFIGNFSHEFKTPIVSIRGFANLAKANNISASERDEYLDIIINESDRLVELSNQTLLLTKLEAKEIVIDKKTFRLDEQIRQALVLLQSEWEERKIELNIDLDKIKITNNQDLLQQLWINIFTNAIKYNKDGGAISVSLKVIENDSVLVTIKDSGIGIDEELIKYIFNKFYQVDPSRTTKGHGLGLAIVKRIITLCNGTISVESEKDLGTTFYITLPKDNA